MSSQDSNEQSLPPPGSICWTDIPVLSLPRAQAFYAEAFNWTFRNPMDKDSSTANCPEEKPGEKHHPPMVMFASGPTHGGLTLVQEDRGGELVSPLVGGGKEKKGRTAVTVYVAVEEVNAGIERVKKAGGEVVQPREVLPNNSGVIALVSDTEKNVLGLWSMK